VTPVASNLTAPMPALVDTTVLVYRFDPRFPEKQRRADELLRRGIADGSLRLAHQSIVEFVAATTRALPDGQPLLQPATALLEAEDLMRQFPIIYLDDRVVRVAFRGVALYGLSWFDANLWAFAEVHGLPVLYSEDFQDGRWYGTVRMVDPFREKGEG
jgi:predicted nucleic acid-binding protein